MDSVTMVDTMEDTIPTMEAFITLERGLLMLNLLLMPRLIPTIWVDTMAWGMLDTIPDTMGMVITSERGLQMLSLLLMPRLIPTTWVGTMVDTMALDTMATVDTLDIPIGDKLDLECQIKQRPAQMTCPSFFQSVQCTKKHKNKHFSHLYITLTSL